MKHPLLLAGTLALPLLLAASPALADEEIPTAATTPCVQTPANAASATNAPTSEWYGWQIILADSASTGLLFAASAGVSPAVAVVGSAVGYLGAGPIIHGVHDRPGAARGSLGLRTGVPLGGALVGGMLAAGGSRRDSGLAAVYGGLLGFGTGLVIASILDVSILARKTTEVKAAPSGKVLWRPNVALNRRSAEVGVSGAF